MANNSAVAGFLTPNPAPSPVPLEDDALDDFFQAVVVGLTGLSKDVVRPRWQVEPPTQPDRSTNWMAVGVIDEGPDAYAAMIHGVVNGEPVDTLQRHEDLDVLISSYGPNARANIKLVADGLQVEQNRDVLIAAGMGMKETSRIVPAAEVVKDGWLRRFDMHLIVRRNVARTYNILDVGSAEVQLFTEPQGRPAVETVIEVNPPSP